MSRHCKLARGLPAFAFAVALFAALPLAAAQEITIAQTGHEHHGGHTGHAAPAKPAAKPSKPAPKKKKKTPTSKKHPAAHKPAAGAAHQAHRRSQGHQHTQSAGAGHRHDAHAAMKGFLGPYPMTREGSGTSWVPDATPHEGIHATVGEWNTMWHALINGVYDRQGGPRGGEKTFVNGMVMGMAQRQIGDGTLGFRAMLSPDPFMGPSGYPLLLATGETANGVTPLVDRQHPHELFMELATTYSYNISARSSVFIYAGLPGEPALGPPAFMHRTSGMDIPEAPITHHWLDSTHITFGVVTAGIVLDTFKIEASTFRGREPDQHRFDIEAPRLDSFSARLTWNPIREVSAQVSWGRLRSPEQLEPEIDEDRISASIIYTQPFGTDNIWSTTAAWGRKIQKPGDTLDGFLLESAAVFQKRYTIFMRAERVDSHELLHNVAGVDEHLAHANFAVSKVSAGGIYDIPLTRDLKFGIGALVSKYGLPGELTPFYGSDPTSYMAFFRLKVS